MKHNLSTSTLYVCTYVGVSHLQCTLYALLMYLINDFLDNLMEIRFIKDKVDIKYSIC